MHIVNHDVVITKTKNFFKTHKTKLALTAAGIATIGCAYYLGKSKGATVIELFMVSKDEYGEYQKQLISTLK